MVLPIPKAGAENAADTKLVHGGCIAHSFRMKEKRRVGSERSATRATILDATQAVMVEEGYAAVSTRRVADRAGIKPALVQYYFPTMDDLLLAVYRRAAERSTQQQREAMASGDPLRTLWTQSTDPDVSVLAVEFMALANHRKVIRLEIAQHIELTRTLLAEAFAQLLPEAGIDPALYPPAAVSLLIEGAARALIMEQGLGVSIGHDQMRLLVERWLHRIGSPPGAV
ncbi:TetR/AcrR family transcriptional regulator [Sphingomonas sp. G-3-2-10]|uniref:TetR/AcrR family transcriptional regulator n=1 Tax=Sphingomonas sp. G-3-2-10 TaxID=2728838 RepID=UPI003216C1D4